MVNRPVINLPKIRSRGPLADKVYKILKDAIIQGKFQSGMWLQEELLTTALDVSRTPVREAFNRLKSEGFIDVQPRKGAYIIELSDSELDELFEVREQVETAFFTRSAENLSAGEIRNFYDRLKEDERAMRESAKDPEKWNTQRRNYLKSDREFHDTLIKAAGNKYWERLYFDIRDRIEIYGNQISLDQEWFDVAIADHYSILDAIESGNYKEGRLAMQRHIRNVRKGIARKREARPKMQ